MAVTSSIRVMDVNWKPEKKPTTNKDKALWLKKAHYSYGAAKSLNDTIAMEAIKKYWPNEKF